MELIRQNKVVSLYKIDPTNYAIYTNQKVGKINLILEEHEAKIEIEIDPPYTKKHYASNALYLFSDYVHQELSINIIHMIVPVQNEQLKHVVEHSGYYIVSRDHDSIYYAHRTFEARKDLLTPIKDRKVLYLAGGCFWGMERVFKILNGVTQTSVGYANGTLENPSYADIIRNETHYKETVKVVYDPSIVSTSTILKAYFLCIHPEQKDGQGEDIGEQYTTGIYYTDPLMEEELQLLYHEEEKKHSSFYVELKPLECYYLAEDYHQDYLTKNPNGYCHITLVDIEKVKQLNQ